MLDGIEDGATWEYSLDGGGDWQEGSGSSFDLEVGEYADGAIQVRQTNDSGVSEITSLGPVTVVALGAADDAAAADMGMRVSLAHPPVSDDNLQVVGLLDSGDETNSISVNVPDVAGLGVLGLTSDNTLTANVKGLAPGEYTVIVRKGDSALGTLLGGSDEGISLEQLGEGGVVLGPENQGLVLDAVESALNDVLLVEALNLGLGTVVRDILEPLLDLTSSLGAGQLVDVLTEPLDTLGLTGYLDDVTDAIADALLSNTLTLLQDTSVSVTVIEHGFEGDGEVSGNVIDPDGGMQGEPGEDSAVPGTVVTQVQFGTEAPVTLVEDVATVVGAYGTLEISEDGSYTYTPDGELSSVGQTEEFSYTISDGYSTAEAVLAITIDGERLTDDLAQAGVEYDYVVSDGIELPDALSYSWLLITAGLPVGTEGSLTGATFQVDPDTTQDVMLTVDVGSVLGVGGGATVFLEQQVGADWTEYAEFSASQLLSLLGSGGAGSFVVPGLPEGEYRVRAELDFSLVSVAGEVSVGLQSTVTHLDQFEFGNVFTAEGDLFENDLLDTPPTGLRVSADGGTTFEEATAGAPAIVNGQYGELSVNIDGTYTYVPNEGLPDTGVPFGQSVDTFTYQVVIDEVTHEASLTVNVNGTLQGGGLPAQEVEGFDAFSLDDDVVALGDVVAGNSGDTIDDGSTDGFADNADDMLADGLFDEGEGERDVDLSAFGGGELTSGEPESTDDGAGMGEADIGQPDLASLNDLMDDQLNNEAI